MVFNSSRVLFLVVMVLGSLISISATSWIGVWLGLEINLLAFVPLMMTKNIFSAEAALKYFLVQALASSVLLFVFVLQFILQALTFSLFWRDGGVNLLIVSILIMKMGAAPFHFWFPGVMEGLNWGNCLILMVWQKVAPFIIISYNFSFSLILICGAITSVVVGAVGGFNQTSLRKIIAYSSINHIGWMLRTVLLGEINWLVYLIFYSFLTISVVGIFAQFRLVHINQIFSSPVFRNTIKFFCFCNLLSLGGLPPFLGFLPKWVVIQGLVNSHFYFLTFILVISALITLFFYVRIGYAAFLLTYYEPKWGMLTGSASLNWSNLVLTRLTLRGLLLCGMILIIF